MRISDWSSDVCSSDLFTYIDDIVAGVIAALDRPPAADGALGVRHRIYNLGNHRSEPLMRFISVIEAAVGRKAEIDFQPMQPGDVRATYADIETSRRDLGRSEEHTSELQSPQRTSYALFG